MVGAAGPSFEPPTSSGLRRDRDEIVRFSSTRHTYEVDPPRVFALSSRPMPKKRSVAASRSHRLVAALATLLSPVDTERVEAASAVSAPAPGPVSILLDHLDVPVLWCDVGGRVLHANRALLTALPSEPERAVVLRTLQQRARAAAAQPPRSGAVRRLQTDAGSYDASASVLADPTSGAPCVLVQLRALASPVHTTASLRARVVARWSLTTREADVALLLAQRLRDREIAAALGISVHTTRRHTERVFGKLGVHSRRGVIDLVRACGDADRPPKASSARGGAAPDSRA